MGEMLRSEDAIGQKWDRCLADGAIKSVSGVGLGIVFSVLFFKRRPWPVAFGAGFGIGMSYANCQNDFLNPNLVRGQIKMIERKPCTKKEEKCESCEDSKKS